MFASFTTGARRLVTLIVARKNYRYEGEHEASSQEYRAKQGDKLFTTNMKNKSVNRVIAMNNPDQIIIKQNDEK